MPASRFDEVLPLLMDGHKQVGVCAMGPIGTGDTIIWMRVWLWQQNGANVAASSGNAGERVEGAHKLKDDEKPPFAAPETKWMVQTGFEDESAEFSIEKPALVQALALVENGGVRQIVQWSQGVGLREPHHH